MNRNVAQWSLIGAVLACGLLAGCGDSGVAIQIAYDRPAMYPIPQDVKRLAVAEFGGRGPADKRWGDYAADRLTGLLDVLNKQYRRYELVDRKRLKAIMDERAAQMMLVSDPDSAQKVGKIAKVDAMIYGNVSVLARDERAFKQVYDFQTKQNKMVPYLKRYAQAAVNFTMNDVQTTKTLATVTISREWDSEKQKKSGMEAFAAAFGGGVTNQNLPPTEQLLNQLVDECVSEIVSRISPHPVVFTEKLGKGKSDLVSTANKLAKANEFREALELYKQGAEVKPDDVDAVFNAGVMLEAMGNRQEAEAMYDRAFKMKPKEQYVMARRRVRVEKSN
ncbi:MAG: Curli production assembly/transport component CsgG [Planctomycetes bacterium ADurb.Bin126]|nr:MAG: Curli production assembly/transport component CsgG [Planctomycetes bacterium ADurb.Bin126]HOD81532.1 CsgG/HfaB family protein [Phycisphaerae bacterium]HQL75045.1 CsgG/HfaB family protein [Phycisphaerae bacterium]